MIYNAKTLASLMYMRVQDEPSYADALAHSNGIYLGKTRARSMPFFLDHTRLINPHIFVVGVTGSGKSYMMKALLYRLSTLTQAKALVIDLTGEYREIAMSLGYSLSMENNALAHGNVCLDMSFLEGEEQKKVLARNVLDEFIKGMRKRKYGSTEIFVFLDEAWKLVEYDIIELLIREGRKYNVGLVLASQMLNDIKDSLFENIATFFVFRLQNGDALDKLAKNYKISAAQLSSVQELSVGSCLVIQMQKAGSRSAFFIRRIEGVDTGNAIVLYTGDKMEISIKEKELEHMLNAVGISQISVEFNNAIENGRRIRLDRLISALIRAGADKREILRQLRAMHMPEKEIAEAFAMAVTKGNEDA